ncbi:MAG: hypothetical protein ACD_75C01959G0001 [uncultured bacterium]|nr:MAG: hypothetical protein ACD_75C01959G0001 [uncultured bacterium]
MVLDEVQHAGILAENDELHVGFDQLRDQFDEEIPLAALIFPRVVAALNQAWMAADPLESGDDGENVHIRDRARTFFQLRQFLPAFVDHLPIEGDLVVTQLADPVVVDDGREFRQDLAPASPEDKGMDQAAELVSHLFAVALDDRLDIEPLELALATQETWQTDVEKRPEVLQGVFHGSAGEADLYPAVQVPHRLMGGSRAVFQVLNLVEEDDIEGLRSQQVKILPDDAVGGEEETVLLCRWQIPLWTVVDGVV